MGNVGTERTVTNVAAGRVSATSTDAVNGSQLFATNQAVDEINTTINNLDTEGLGLVKQDQTTRNITVAKTTDGKRVEFAGTAGERVLGGVAKGAVNETSTEGVNGSQLYGTNKSVADSLGGGAKVNPDGTITGPTYNINNKPIKNVGDALTEIDGRVTNVDGRVTKLGDQINNGEIGLVRQDATSRDITVAKEKDGTRVDFTGTAGARKLVGVAKGAVNETSTEGVNGSQLYGTNKSVADSLGGGAKVNPDGTITGPTYNINNKPIKNVGDALTEIDGRVTNVDGRVTNLGDQINNGQIGLVQQDGVSRDITVAKGKDGTRVDFTGTAGARKLVGVAKGAVNETSTEGVNGSQLYGTNKSVADSLGGGAKVNPDGTITGPTYNINNKSIKNVGDALTEIDGRVTNVDGRVTKLGDQINNGEIGLVRQDATSRDITVAKGTDGTRVDFTGTAGARKLAGVAKGAVNETSNEGVNGSQLYGTNKSVADSLGGGAKVNPDGTITGPTYNINNKSINNVGDALTEVDGRVTNVDRRVTNLGDQINGGKGIKYFRANSTLPDATASGIDSIAIGPQAVATAQGSLAMGQGANAAQAGSVALGAGSRTAAAIATPSATVGGKNHAFAGAAPSSTVSVGDVGAERTVTNVAAGRLSASSTDAVNGSQLFATNQVVDEISNTINNIDTGGLGLVKQDQTTRNITVAKATDGKRVEFAGTAGERVLGGVAKGAINETSTEAVNGSQLYGTNKTVADGLGGGAKVNPDGTITGPTYNINNKPITNVGDALTEVDGRVTNVDGRVTKLGDQINNGEIGLVRQDATSRDITVAKDRDGTRVDFTGTAGARKLVGVAKGAVNETSTEGVNGSQLYGTNKSVADSLGGGSKVNPDGTITGPTYIINKKPITNVGDALTEIDGRVTNLGDQINGGGLGLVKQNTTTRDIEVARGTDGKRVEFAGTAGERVLGGVAKGAVNETSTEGVNGSQLYGTNKSVADSLGGGAKVNPDGTITGPTYNINNKPIKNVGDALTEIDGRVTNVDDRVTNLGDQINNGEIGLVRQDATSRDITVAKGTDGTRVDFTGTAGARKLAGVAKGEVSATSTEAVNGAQLNEVDGRVTNLGDQINGGKGIKYFRANSSLADAVASGMNAVAIGPEAMASAAGAVALGQGAIADRENTVSVGSALRQRQIVNVARGTQQTDVVNVSQLTGALDALGGGAKVNPDGSIKGPTYIVNNKPVTNVGDAITNLGDMINNSSTGPGLVQQDTASRDITVAKATDGKRVDFRGNEGDRVLAGVAKGAVNEASTEGVNGSQLHNTNKTLVDGLGGGAKVNPDGSITGPTYIVNNKPVTNVGDAITDIDGRISNISNGGGVKYFHANSTAEDSVAAGQDAVAAGPRAKATGQDSVALGNGAQSQGANSVALGAGSVAERDNTVSVGAQGKERTITHVAAGKEDTDAVNVSQLRDSKAGTLQYDRSPTPGSGPDFGSLTLGDPNGGGGGTVVRNVREGTGPTDAVNVRQLQSGMQSTLRDANNYTDRRISQIQNDTWVAQREARAGTAAAMAMAGMPQAYLPGKSMLAAAVGGYQGEGALAVGLSAITDNGRYIYKAQLSGNTRGDMGFSVGAGIQW